MPNTFRIHTTHSFTQACTTIVMQAWSFECAYCICIYKGISVHFMSSSCDFELEFRVGVKTSSLSLLADSFTLVCLRLVPLLFACSQLLFVDKGGKIVVQLRICYPVLWAFLFFFFIFHHEISNFSGPSILSTRYFN